MLRGIFLFTGPECSGKTSISRWAAETFGGAYVPEYARQYLELNGPKYSKNDLIKIAQGQRKLEMEAMESHDLIFCDTSLIVVDIWMREVFHDSLWQFDFNPNTMKLYDHVYLCRPDFQWQQDGLRENPEDRDRLYMIYEQTLSKMEIQFTSLIGSISDRQHTLSALLRHYL